MLSQLWGGFARHRSHRVWAPVACVLYLVATCESAAGAEDDPSAPPGDVEVLSDPELDGPPSGDSGESVRGPEGGGAGAEDIRDRELDGTATIGDPELDGAAASGAGTQTIRDPELSGSSSEPGSGDAFGPDVVAYTEVRGFLATRVGVDLAWTVPTEDVVEATQIGQIEMIHHPSDRVGIGLGVRARHVAAFREEDGAGRFGLDVAPVAGYGDFAVGNVTHLRVGYQIIQLGRFDVFSSTNLLAVYDLRSGAATMPEANHVAQPAVRLDADPSEHWSLTGVYVPFFMPHLVDLTGTDYSGFAATERELAEARDDPMTPTELIELADYLDDAVGRSALNGLSNGAFSAFSPAPDLTDPQGAVRATLRGTAGALSVTGLTALERLPVLELSDELLAFDPINTPIADARTMFGDEPVGLRYGRFYVAAVDGATDIGPVQVGVEVAYQFDRTLTSIDPSPPATVATLGDLGLPTPETTDMIQVAVRGELLEGEGFVVVLEGFGAMALSEPSQPSRRYLLLDDGRRYYGLGGGLRWSPDQTGLKLELGGAALYGPTFVALPRVEYEVSEGLFVELGAVVVEGRQAPVTSADFNLGGLYDTTDQVFTGVRWMP